MEPIRLAAFPFDSQITGYSADGLPEYDRASNSKEFAGLLKGFFRDGVFDNSALQVLAGGGLTATVSAGGVMVQGRVKHLKSAQAVEFETAASLPRLDRVVVRLDLSNAVRDLVLDVLTGTPASTPSAPALTRNDTVWEICLATVRIAASATSVSQSAITDTRLDSSLCGLVAAVLNDFDTNTFYEQVQADLAEFKEEEQAEFDAWFENLQAILDENVAANLQNQIDKRVAVSVQSFTADERTIARNNICALSHEQQTLTAEQKAQARENIGAGEAAELVRFIELATYSTSATIPTLVPFDSEAIYLCNIRNQGATVMIPVEANSFLLRGGSLPIESLSGTMTSIDTVGLSFAENGATSGTVSHINRYTFRESGTVQSTPTSIGIGPIYMLRKIAQ